ncbi:hypothetical protein [Streptomyces boncukensis]|uniref:Uncharacterized protein n=1 Tax=Streptomyces boncukensis TaxID=2711219 RepID=A0A6G4WW81_9ACTN|nr:hypothetical protein [Streptomyces boncukensis]NGO69263.1 hypothetical protein [Streptomyces boncukensis]
MSRVSRRPHPLKRTPYNQIVAALIVATLFLGPVLMGGIATVVAIGLWVVALIVSGQVYAERQVRKAARARVEDERWHDRVLDEREARAEAEGMEYEEQSQELAARFGRMEQHVPRLSDPRHEARARHTSDLTAEGVLHMTRNGYPVTLFDLEVVNERDMHELRRRSGGPQQALRYATEYLTVCAVTLPYALPYLSSFHAWECDGPDMRKEKRPEGLDHTDDPRYAALMLSVPALREAAWDVRFPWTVSGDQLVTAARSSTGLALGEALDRAAALSALAAGFPWDRLDAFRGTARQWPAPWPPHRTPLSSYANHDDVLGTWAHRWAHRPMGTSGLYALDAGGVWFLRRRGHV